MKGWQQLIAGVGVACSLHCGWVEGNFEEAACRLFQRAAESNSDVVMLTRSLEPICIYGQDKELEPIETRSITKTFVGLAVGMMFQEGYINSLETPVYHFFPEWNQGNKKHITLLHLLNHTSGISTEGDFCTVEQVPDIVRFALASELSHCPGTRFIYNNKATNLLAAIVQKATGVSVHEYLKRRLFQPLGITSDTWICDSAGNNFGMSHLTINAKDLTKVGLVLANQGRWNGVPLLNEEWIYMMTQPSQEFNPFYGLLCWLSYHYLEIHWSQELIDFYGSEGVNPYYLRCLASLCGRVFTFNDKVSYGRFLEDCSIQLAGAFGSVQDVRNFFVEIENKGLPLGIFKVGKVQSFSARGYQGQKMLVIPEEKVVVVRLARTCGALDDGQPDIFNDLESNLENVVKECNNRDHMNFSEPLETFEEPQLYTECENDMPSSPKKKKLFTYP